MRRRFDRGVAWRLSRSGVSDCEIARRLGVSPSAVNRAFREFRNPVEVPTEIVAPYLEAWLTRQEDGSLEEFSRLSGVGVRTLYAIRYGERRMADLSTVDRILVVIGRPDIWHVE